MEEEFEKNIKPMLTPDQVIPFYNNYMNLEIEPSTLTKANIVEQR